MKVVKSSGNVFADIGIDGAEAEDLAVKADLVTLLLKAIRLRGLTQQQAASICRIDQPTLSKVINGKLGISTDRIAHWIVALGGQIEINVHLPKAEAGQYKGQMRVHAS
jgi:predicted XRE-type DNA-binding protein